MATRKAPRKVPGSNAEIPSGGYVGARPKDTSKLSMKPEHIRNRLRRARKTAEKTGDDSVLRWELQRYHEVTGFKPVEDWDLEELAHGRPRGPSGTFRGPSPKWITADVAREAKKRLHGHTFGKMGAQVDLAIKTIYNLMTSEEVDDKGKPIVDARTKLAAAQFILEHVVGKPEKIISLDVTDHVRQVIASAIVLDSGQEDSHLVIEGDIVEDEELMADDHG